MSHHALHIVFTVAGAVCEVIGLSWLVANASRERGAKYGEYGLIRRIRNWFAFWLFTEPPKAVNIEVHAAANASATGHLSIRTSAETDIQRLERELGELRSRVENYEAQTARRFAGVEQSVREAANTLHGRIEQVAQQQHEQHRSALRSDVRAGRLFILGAILSMIANLL